MCIETKYKYKKVFLNLNLVIPNQRKFFSREEFKYIIGKKYHIFVQYM